MNKYLSLSLKLFWLATIVLLITLPIFVPSFGGIVNVVNVCLLASVLLSFPCNILVLPFFAFPDFHHTVSIQTLYTQLLICATLSYFQWFVLFPQLLKFKRKSNAKKSRFVADETALLDAESIENWQKNWYDEQKRTPVERIFDDKDE